ncbi:MAG TPA: sigma-70 family RNA polymerase sigma factor [Terriglobales bacterium]|nr:sigma-70 family RNA polymerase sigma factor [Terriglobales bacterium]
MPKDGVQSVVQVSAGLDSVVTEIYEKSRGEVFGLTRQQFDGVLGEIARKYLPAGAAQNDVRELYASLRAEDLALARACAAGHEHAWEVFLTRYREKLYDIAGYITKESSTARELADSIYAELYGTTTRDGQRTSKLASYTGRGSLEGWLRTVMAQEHINRYRRQRRLVSLDEETEEGFQFATPESELAIAVDPRVESATDEVLAALPSEDRFVLASYFLDERTLAEIARTLGVHESTISRKLDKLAKSLRKQILASLGRCGMSRRQAQEALDVDVRDLRVNIRSRLAQETGGPAFSKKKAEAPADGS